MTHSLLINLSDKGGKKGSQRGEFSESIVFHNFSITKAKATNNFRPRYRIGRVSPQSLSSLSISKLNHHPHHHHTHRHTHTYYKHFNQGGQQWLLTSIADPKKFRTKAWFL